MSRRLLAISIIVLAVSACQKHNAGPAGGNNSLHIDSFILHSADNFFLYQTDTVGVIGTDTITLIFPGRDNTANFMVSPTISFTGTTISPASGVLENFDSTLTYTVSGDGAKRTYIIKVIFTADNELLTSQRRLYAWDLGTGNARWIAQDNYMAGLWSSPWVDNGRVYCGGDDGTLYVSDAVTGKLLANPRLSYITNEIMYSPAVYNNVVYIGDGNGNLYAVDATTDVAKWTKNLGPYGLFTTPTMAGNVLYVQSSNVFYAVDPASGNIIWTAKAPMNYFSSPVINGSLAYISGDDSNFYAVNVSTGATAWSLRLGGMGTTPALANGTLYVTTNADSLFALDATTGARKWAIFVDQGPQNPSVSYAGIQSYPSVYNGMVFTGGGDANLYAFDATNGTLKWTTTLINQCMGGVFCVNGVLYPNASGMSTYAVDAATGKIKWQSDADGGRTTAACIGGGGIAFNPAY